MKTKCGCVILNYNDSETTLLLVDKIKDYQVFDYLIIVDNCSTDNSFSMLKRIQDEHIILLQTDKNGGYGAGNNFGIFYAWRELGLKYVLLANPDVSFSNDLIQNMCEYMEHENNVAACTAVQHDINNQPIRDLAWKIPTPFQYAVMTSRYLGTRFTTFYSKPWTKTYEEVECVPGAMVLFNAGLFTEIGGYDEEMFLYCEEVVIAIKLKKAGYKTILKTDDYYLHEHSVSINKTIRENKKQKELIYNNRLFVMKKYLNAGSGTIWLAKFFQKRALNKMR